MPINKSSYRVVSPVRETTTVSFILINTAGVPQVVAPRGIDVRLGYNGPGDYSITMPSIVKGSSNGSVVSVTGGETGFLYYGDSGSPGAAFAIRVKVTDLAGAPADAANDVISVIAHIFGTDVGVGFV